MTVSMRVSCPKCSVGFEYEEDLKFHVSELHLFYRPYKCTDCDWASASWTQIAEHKELDHPSSNRSVLFLPIPSKSEKLSEMAGSHGTEPDCCPKCEEWEAPTGGKLTALESLRCHIRGSHFSSKPFYCALCPTSLSSWPPLLPHFKRKHPDSDPKIYIKFDGEVERSISALVPGEKPPPAHKFSNSEYRGTNSSIDDSIVFIEESPGFAHTPGPLQIKTEPEEFPMMVDLNVRNLTRDNEMTTVPKKTQLEVGIPFAVKTELSEDTASHDSKSQKPPMKQSTRENFATSENSQGTESHFVPSLAQEQASPSESSLDHSQLSSSDSPDIGDAPSEDQPFLSHQPSLLTGPSNDEPHVKSEVPGLLVVGVSVVSSTSVPESTPEHFSESGTDISKTGEDVTATGSSSFHVQNELKDERLAFEEPETEMGTDLKEESDMNEYCKDPVLNFGIETDASESEVPEPFVSADLSPNVTCSLCCKEIENTEDQKKDHAWLNHLGSPQAIRCPECPLTTEYEMEKMEQHMERYHPDSSQTIVDRREDYEDGLTQILEVCFSTEGFEDAVQTPLPARGPRKPPKNGTECVICSVVVSNDSNAKKNHIWQHHLGNPRAYKCEECDAEFGLTKKSATDHIESKHGKTDGSGLVDLRVNFAEAIKEQWPACFKEEQYKATKGTWGKKVKEFCRLCDDDVIVTSKQGKIQHVWQIHLENPQCLKCRHCSFTAGRSKSFITIHGETKHPDEDPADFIDTRETLTEPLSDLLKRCFGPSTRSRSIGGEKKHNIIRKIHCFECNSNVDITYGGITTHVWKEHMGNPQALLCSLCTYSDGRDTNAIMEHLKSVHDENNHNKMVDDRGKYMETFYATLRRCTKEIPEDEITTSCNLCGNSVPDNKRSRRLHVWCTHLGGPSAIACALCPYKNLYDPGNGKLHIEAVHKLEREAVKESLIDLRDNYRNDFENLSEQCFPPVKTPKCQKPLKTKTNTEISDYKTAKKFCRLCKKDFSEVENFVATNHIWDEHMGSPVALHCLLCDFTSARLVLVIKDHLLEAHQSTDDANFTDRRSEFHDELGEKFELCFQTFYRGKTAGSSIPCKLCNRDVPFATKKTLRNHVWKRHMVVEDAIKCSACSFSTKYSVAEMELHLEENHPELREGGFIDDRPQYEDEVNEKFVEAFGSDDPQKPEKRTTRDSDQLMAPKQHRKYCKLCDNMVDLEADGLMGHVKATHMDGSKFEADEENSALSERMIECFGRRALFGRASRSSRPSEKEATDCQQYVKKCGVCSESVSIKSVSALKLHAWKAHMGNPQSLSCHHCSFTTGFSTKALRSHHQQNHPDLEENFGDKRDEYREELRNTIRKCFHGSRRSSNMSSKSRESKPMELRMCRVCEKEVDINQYRESGHVWSEHMGNPRALFCPHCTYANGRDMGTMNAHIAKVHKNREKKDIIDNRTQFTEDLENWLRKCFVSTTKPRKRPEKETIRRNSDLHDIETRICSLCGDTVRDIMDTMKRHIWRSHLGDPKSCQCRICGSTFGYDFASGTIHMKAKHPEADMTQLKDNRPMYQRPTLRMLQICFPKLDKSSSTKKRKISTVSDSSAQMSPSVRRENSSNPEKLEVIPTEAETLPEKLEQESETKEQRSPSPKAKTPESPAIFMKQVTVSLEKSLGAEACLRDSESRSDSASQSEGDSLISRSREQDFDFVNEVPPAKRLRVSSLGVKEASVARTYGDLATTQEVSRPQSSSITSSSRSRTCQACHDTVEEGTEHLRKHVWVFHMNNPKAYTCKLCPFSVTLKKNHILEHAKEAHSFLTSDEIASSFIDNFSELKQIYSRKKLICFP